jgi:hypothetical protein
LYEGENPVDDDGSNKLYIQSATVPLEMAGKVAPKEPAKEGDNEK